MPDTHHFPDTSGETVMDLAGRWSRNALALIDHHQQVAALTGDEIRAHAMTALSTGQELADVLAAWMPVLARWAREQRDDARITPGRFREVMHLAGWDGGDL